MRILVLNGSPHPAGATADMVSAFEKGAKEAGHEVMPASSPPMATRTNPKKSGRNCTHLEKT